MEKNVNFSVSSKVLAATALGAGVLLGASTAYILTRIHEHSNLAHLVSKLHTSIIEVKEEISHLENELSLLQRVDPLPKEKPLKARHRKAVSFSSTATTSSFKTTVEHFSDTASYKTSKEYLTDSDSWKSPYTTDTDYFSPVEDEEDDDDDEFYDMSPTDDEGDATPLPLLIGATDNSISHEVSDLAKLLRKVDNLIEKSPEEQIQAYELLMDKGHKYGDNAEILWRKAKATRNMATIEEMKGNLEKKKDYFYEAYEYAERALEINDKSAEIHKWFAILAGARGEFLSTKERIASGHVFKKHIDIALQISPNDSTLHHLLGRFCYEVSLLTWVEKKVASAVFGSIPSSSFEEAREHFMAADELKHLEWKENKLFIAKCCFQLSDTDEGEEWLRKALSVKVLTAEDELMDKEIQKLMEQYSISF